MNINKIIPVILIVLFVSDALLLLKLFNSEQSKLKLSQIIAEKDNVLRLKNHKFKLNINLDNEQNSKLLDSNLQNQLKKSRYTLLVLFEPTQYGSCLDEGILWDKLEENNLLPVIGITTLSNKSELYNFINESNIEIPIYVDKDSIIEKHLGAIKLPIKLLIDSSATILIADYVRQDEADRNEFYELLKYYIKN